jgi:hypothetical protein
MRRCPVKRKASLIVVFLMVSVLFASLAFAEFLGSRHSNKYHYPSCRWAQKIKPANLVRFETPEAAIKAGYVPCKVCRPPTRSNSGK